jgi:hypothetical protein
MKTDYMVIGRIRNAANVARLIEGIRDKGFTCYSFLENKNAPRLEHLTLEQQLDQFEGMTDFWSDPAHRHYYELDMQGLKNANTLIMLLPSGLAAHMEAGVAFGMSKQLILIGEVEKPETLYLMFDEKYPTIESFLEKI